MIRGSFLALALATICIAGCSFQKSSDDPGTLRFLIESAPVNLDPRIGTDAQSEHIDGLIFSSLVARNDQMEAVPDLAESWETPDPLTYIFHLRHGVKFHDGRDLTSEDVKYTFDSILSGAIKTPKKGTYRSVESIDAPDPYTVIFRLHEPFASLLWNLTCPGVGIVPGGSRSACLKWLFCRLSSQSLQGWRTVFCADRAPDRESSWR